MHAEVRRLALLQRRHLLPGARRPRGASLPPGRAEAPSSFLYLLPVLGPASRKLRWVLACGSGVRSGGAERTLVNNCLSSAAQRRQLLGPRLDLGQGRCGTVRALGNLHPLRLRGFPLLGLQLAAREAGVLAACRSGCGPCLAALCPLSRRGPTQVTAADNAFSWSLNRKQGSV